MAYEELSLSGFVKEIKETSEGPHPRKFCFVLGAGASKSSGIKSGQELVDIWDKELEERNKESHEKWKKEKGITEENKYGFYSQFYEKRFFREPRDGYNYLEKLMEPAKPKIGYVMLAFLLTKKESKYSVVITTNFDHLTEDAVSYYTHTIPLVVGHESLAHYITKEINRATIVKIHRDLLFDPKNTQKDVEVLHENWEKALDSIFSEYHPVFIGYAGNDKSLMNFLSKNSANFADGKWKFPYWLIYKTEALSGGVKDFLDNAKGYLIKHDGFDAVMYRLGAELGYTVPKENEFLKEPRERFKAIKDYINGFTDNQSKDKEALETILTDKDTDKDLENAIQKVTDQDDNLKMYREALWLHNNKKYSEALEIEKKLINTDKNNARYHNLCGTTLNLLWRFEEAAEEKQKAVRLEPNNAFYHNNLALTLYEMKKYKEAIAEIEFAFKIMPSNAVFAGNLAFIYTDRKDYGLAEKYAEQAIKLQPEDAIVYDNYGYVLQSMKKYEDALKQKFKALELEPENAKFYTSIATTYQLMKRYDKALENVNIAIQKDPYSVACQNRLGLIYRKMKRYDEALAAAQKTIELDNNCYYGYTNLATTLREMQRYDEALKYDRRAVEINSWNITSRCSLSKTLMETGELEEALQQAEKAIDLDPQHPAGYNCAGLALRKMNRLNEALDNHTNAVMLENDNAEYQYNFGVLLDEMQRYDEALEAKKKAVELEPDNEDYRNSYNETLKKIKPSAA